MISRRAMLAVAGAWLGVSLNGPALAQRGSRGGVMRAPRPAAGPSRANPIDEFETLPPEEQQKALGRLPAEERQKLQERLRKFNALPPQQQEALKALYNRLHQLPAERQQAVRSAIGKFAEAKPDRQEAMRDALRRLAPLQVKERQGELRSSEFRSGLSKKEQEIVREMSALLP